MRHKIRILFSDTQLDWEPEVQFGFRFVPQCKLAFEDIRTADLSRYDLVVPFHVRDLNYLNQVRPLIARNPIPIPSAESVALCDDKLLFNQALIRKGFGRLIPNMEGPQRYPYILKKRIDMGSDNSHVVHGTQEEQMLANLLKDPDYFCQEYIPGSEECATHILFKDHKILCSLNIKYGFIGETPMKRKSKIAFTRRVGCPYLDLFSSILLSIGFEGLCNIGYKVVDHRPYVLEINPRFGASLSPYFYTFIRHLDI